MTDDAAPSTAAAPTRAAPNASAAPSPSTTPGPRPHQEVVGDRALEEATGRSRVDWYALLDAAGATEWKHRDIASWLVREHGVDAWWSQGLTVGYEQERGIRVPGQQQDGLFECSVSRTLPLVRERAYAAVTDVALRSQWLDLPVTVTGATPPASVRWALPDGTRAVVRVEAVRPGVSRVVVQHARLPDGAAVSAAKAAWKSRLAALAERATGA